MPETGMVYWALIEKVFDDVSIYDGPREFQRQFLPLPQKVRHLLAAHWCQSEVCNGGFDQFFLNSTGVLAPEAAEGFRAMGLERAAVLLERAMAKFGERYPRNRAATEAQDGPAAQGPGNRWTRAAMRSRTPEASIRRRIGT